LPEEAISQAVREMAEERIEYYRLLTPSPTPTHTPTSTNTRVPTNTASPTLTRAPSATPTP
jgi:hypothetical protein